MAGVFQPPPTWALPVIVDEMTGKAIFNPVWLRWFVDFSANVGTGGAGSGNVISVNTKTGEVILIASDVGAPFLATTNHWPQMQYFDGNIDTLSFFLAGGPTGGIGPKVDNESVLGAVGYRWKNLETYLLGLVGNFTWNGYVIVPPDGTTTGFLRKDGTWATPAGTGAQLNVANTWTALQTFNADIRTPTFGTVVGYGVAPTVTDTYENGDAAFRWLNTITKNLTLGENLVWNALTIPKPTGGTTTFLRNDGTWATPPASGASLSVANTWTAKQTFSAEWATSVLQTFDVASGTPGLQPLTDNQSQLGTASLRWKQIYTKLLDCSGDFKWGAYTIPVPTGDITKFLRNDGTWAASVPGVQQVGGIRKTTGTSIGALAGGYTSIVSYQSAAYTNTAGISHNLTNGTITFSVAGDYNLIMNILAQYDGDTSDRFFGLRLWDATSSVIVAATTVGVAPNTTALSESFVLPVTIAAGRLTHALVMQIGDGSTFANFTVGAATLAATSIGPLS